MERITEKISNEILVKNKNGNGSRSICYGCDGISNCTTRVCNFYRAMEKLVAYEDTGLEPEDIKNNTKVTFDVGSDGYLQAIEIAFKDRFGMTTKEVVEVLDKCKEYKDLEEQGRLIKLPFEIGSKVWLLYTDSKEIAEVKITEFMALSHLYRLYFSSGSCYTVTKGQEWKYLFSTREEAEKVLKERGDYY